MPMFAEMRWHSRVQGTHHAGRVAAVELLLLLLERRRRGRLLPLLLLVRTAQRASGWPAEALGARRTPHAAWS